MFGFGSSHKNDLLLVVDVESDGASAAIVLMNGAEPAEIVVAAHAELPYETRSKDAQTAGVRACLDEVTEKVLTLRPKDVRGALMCAYGVVHMPWTDVRVVRGDARHPGEVKITSGLISRLAQEAMKRESMDAATHIESSIIRVELNGYPTGVPIDKRAKHIVLTVLVSNCEASIREGMIQAVSKAHISKEPILRSSVRGFTLGASSIPTMPPGDHTIVDISRAGARVIHVQNGLPVTLTTIEYGLQSLFAQIAPKKHPADILAMMHMVENGESDEATRNSFLQDLGRAEVALSEMYAKAFTSVAALGLLPEHLILIVHPTVAPWLSRFFTHAEFATCVVTHRPFTVTVLSPEHFISEVKVREHVDVSLGLLSATALVHSELNSHQSVI
jgi:hypothetical protein